MTSEQRAAAAAPCRNMTRSDVEQYLGANVFPVLKEALAEMCLLQPANPFEWLVAHLLERAPPASTGFVPAVKSVDRYRHLLAMQRQLSDSHAAVISPSSPVEVGTAPSSPRVQLPAFHAQFRAQFEQPPLNASSPSERSASPVESSVDRHRRLQMMRQRLSSSGTIIPSDSPALILPPFPSASGQYGEIAAARMQRLQQRAVSPPKQSDQVWSNMQVSPRPALQSPNRAQLPDPEQLTRPF